MHDDPKDDTWRGLAGGVLRGLPFQICIGMCILANAWAIGMETDQPSLWFWSLVEFFFLVVFTGELALRLFVVGGEGFFDISAIDFPWNVFDLAIISVGVLDFFGSAVGAGRQDKGMTFFRLVRLLRILRVFKIVRFLKQLYMLAYGFLEAMKAVFWVTVLMLGVLYMCSVVLVRTVGRHGATSESEAKLEERFGSIPEAMLTLFQIMSQPNLMEYYPLFSDFPLFVGFLISFIIFGSFGMIALLTGVISESMFEKNMLWVEEERAAKELRRKLLGEQCLKLFDALDEEAVNSEGQASKEVLATLIPKVADLFEKHLVSFTEYDLDAILDLIDVNGSGLIKKDEFCTVVLSVAEEVRAMSVIRILYAVARNRDSIDECRKTVAKLSSQMTGHQQRPQQIPQQQHQEQPLSDAQSSAASSSQRRVIDYLQGLSGSLGSVIRAQGELFTQGQSLSAMGSSILQRLGDIDLQIAQARDLQMAQARDQQHLAQRGGGDEMQHATGKLQQVSNKLGSSIDAVAKLQDELLNQSKFLARASETVLSRLDSVDSQSTQATNSRLAHGRDQLKSGRLNDIDQGGGATNNSVGVGARGELLSQTKSLASILQRLEDLGLKIDQRPDVRHAVPQPSIAAESRWHKDSVAWSESLDLILRRLGELHKQFAEDRAQRQSAQKRVIEQLQAFDECLQSNGLVLHQFAEMISAVTCRGKLRSPTNQTPVGKKLQGGAEELRQGEIGQSPQPAVPHGVSREGELRISCESGQRAMFSSATCSTSGSPSQPASGPWEHGITSRCGLPAQIASQSEEGRGRRGDRPACRSTPVLSRYGDRPTSLFSSKKRRSKGMTALGDLVGEMRAVMAVQGPASAGTLSPERATSKDGAGQKKRAADEALDSDSDADSGAEEKPQRRPYYDEALSPATAAAGVRPEQQPQQQRFKTSEAIMMNMFGERLRQMEEMLDARCDSE